MPRQDLVTSSVDATLIPEAAHKFAQRALREHQRAERDAVKAVEHVVKSGQALLKAYDLCEYGQWRGFFEMHFKDETLSLRTGHKYMQLARDWSRLVTQHPDGFASQRQAFKALASLMRESKPKVIDGGCAARGATSSDDGAAKGGKRARTGPVWRASGPFVNEALRLVSSVAETLSNLVSRSYPLESEADQVHAGLKRLQTMLDREIDEAEALQAAGEWTFVTEQARPAVAAADNQIESEDDHDD